MSSVARAARRREARRQQRDNAVYELPEATLFSVDRDLSDPYWVITALKRFPRFAKPFIQATTFASELGGRPRIEGSYGLLYLYFTLSGLVDLQKFCDRHRSTGVFALCDFNEIPTWQTVRLRFIELENYEAECMLSGGEGPFAQLRNALIAHAKSKEPRIGQVVSFDGTQVTAYARLYHMCSDKEACKKASEAAGRKPPKSLSHATDTEISDARSEENADFGDDPSASGSIIEQTGEIRKVKRGKNKLKFRIHLVNGHEYGCLDLSAGVRNYEKNGGPHFWIGGLSGRVFDIFTGATLLELLIPANKQEFRAYPEAITRTEAALGEMPRSATTDKGLCVPAAYEFSARNAIEQVSPWRRPNWRVKDRTTLSTDLYDYHGEPRCQYCGGPGLRKGWYQTSSGEPRIRFVCQLRSLPDCREKTQSIACAENFRLLGLLGRREPRYHILRALHGPTERGHENQRARTNTAPKEPRERQKNRRGLRSAQLRANAAGVIEWFRVNLRQGWLGNHPKRNRNEPIQLTRGREALQTLLRSRELNGVDLPYGQAAIDTGLAWDEAPDGYKTWKQRKLKEEREKKASKVKGGNRKKARTADRGERTLIQTAQGLVDADTGELVYALTSSAGPPAGTPPGG